MERRKHRPSLLETRPRCHFRKPQKYGGHCFSLSQILLSDFRDAEECVSDTFLGIWNAFPPPNCLKLFLTKIARRLAFNCYNLRTAQKLGGGELPLVLEELWEGIGGGTGPQQVVEARELEASIQKFADCLPPRERIRFVRRYFCTESVGKIACQNGPTPGNTSVILNRIRRKLKAHLIQEGFCYE